MPANTSKKRDQIVAKRPGYVRPPFKGISNPPPGGYCNFSSNPCKENCGERQNLLSSASSLRIWDTVSNMLVAIASGIECTP